MEIVGFSNIQVHLLMRLVLAVFLGALIGLEREVSKKHAGMRTYALVSLGAALFTTLSETTYQYFLIAYGGTPNYDPSRIISQIVVGTGFLGAGMVIFHKEKVLGLTSAAGIWVAAAVGAATGIGAYWLAIATTILALFVLVILRWWEDWMKWRNGEQTEKEED